MHVVAAVGVVGVALGMMAGCAAESSPDAWVLHPISYDNRLDGREEESPDIIDVTFPMGLRGDTAGGFWAESAGSWLHVSSSGADVRRFNLEPDAPGMGAALSPTRLVVVSDQGWPEARSVLQVFDAEALSWEDLYRNERPLGALAVGGGVLYFVAYALHEPTFMIEKITLAPGASPVVVLPAVEGLGPVAIDVDASGALYVATSTERIIVAADGSIQSRDAVRSVRPAVAVNDRGDVAWSQAFARDPGVARDLGDARGARDSGVVRDPGVVTEIVGGSAEARRILESGLNCEAEPGQPGRATDWLVIDTVHGQPSPLLCGVAGFSWINDRELVVSVGTESGASLARVTVPETVWRSGS